LKRITYREEFDKLLAMGKAKGIFLTVNYGLLSSLKRNNGTGHVPIPFSSLTEKGECRSQLEHISVGSILLESSVNLGIYLSYN